VIRRCLILTSEYPPYSVGGLGRYVGEVTPRLGEMMEVLVALVPTYCAFDPSIEHYPFDEKVLSLDRRRYRDALMATSSLSESVHLNEMAETIAEECIRRLPPVDESVVFVQDYALAPIAKALRRVGHARKIVAACHLPVFAGFTYFEKPIREELHQVLEAQLIRMADIVVVPSHFVGRVLTLTHNLPPTKLLVIPLGSDRPARTLFPTDRETRLLAIGRPTEQKGYHFLFDAFECLRRAGVSATLTVAPGTEDISRLQTLSGHSLFGRDIRFLAQANAGQMWEIYDTHHLLVTTSVYETFGLSVLEAMTSSLPTIGFPVGAIRELWGDELTRELGTPIGNVKSLVTRLRDLCEQPVARERLSRKVKERSRSFTWSRHVTELRKCFA
jgi:glycogen(starch) synthase